MDIDVGIKEVAQDSCGSSLRSDCISNIKTIRTQNINNVIIGNLNINSLSHDLKVLMTGMFAGADLKVLMTSMFAGVDLEK